MPVVKSLLRRAPGLVLADVPLADEDLAEPTDRGARRVLDRYMMAFRQSDMAAIERLLADDALLEMTGTATWFSGKLTCVPFIAAQAIGRSGDWEMLPLAFTASWARRLTIGVTTRRTTASPWSCWPRLRRTSRCISLFSASNT